MSVETQINRIKANIASAYAKAAEKGAALPEVLSSGNLPAAIGAIPSGGTPEGLRTITVAADPPGKGAVIGDGVVSEGMTVTVKAESADGYRFKEWQESDEIVSVEETYTFQVSKNVSLTAIFQKESRLPEGYTEVEYIQISENFGIDTGIKANFENMRFLLDEEVLGETGSNYFFQSSPSGGRYFNCHHSPTVESGRLFYSFFDRSNWYISLDNQNDIHKRTIFDFNFPEKYFSAFDKPDTIFQSSATMTTNIFIGSVVGSGSRSEAKIFSCQIYASGGKVRDFVPCINLDNAVGLYDLVNNVFYQNSFSGTVIAGPEV